MVSQTQERPKQPKARLKVITVRLPESAREAVKLAARLAGQSCNEFCATVISQAVSVEFALCNQEVAQQVLRIRQRMRVEGADFAPDVNAGVVSDHEQPPFELEPVSAEAA